MSNCCTQKESIFTYLSGPLSTLCMSGAFHEFWGVKMFERLGGRKKKKNSLNILCNCLCAYSQLLYLARSSCQLIGGMGCVCVLEVWFFKLAGSSLNHCKFGYRFVWVALSRRLFSDTLIATTPPLNTPTTCHASCSCCVSMQKMSKIPLSLQLELQIAE